MIDPLTSLPPMNPSWGPRRVEEVQPAPVVRDACDCPPTLLDHLPGSVPFDVHLGVENARARILRRAEHLSAWGVRPSHAEAPSRNHAPATGPETPKRRDEIIRRIHLIERYERVHRAGVVLDLVA